LFPADWTGNFLAIEFNRELNLLRALLAWALWHAVRMICIVPKANLKTQRQFFFDRKAEGSA
jgi:hypothetical protein